MAGYSHSAGSHSGSTCWNRTGDERLELIADGLTDNEDIRKKVPGLRTLLKEYVDPNVPVSPPDFHKRLLRVFRESDYDSAYQECLEKLTPDEKERVEKFVADDQPLEDVSSDFDMCVSIGVREHLQHLIGVDCALVSSAGVQALAAVPPPGPPVAGVDGHTPVETEVEGLSGRSSFDWLKDKDTVFHSFLHKLKDLLTGHEEEHKVIVSAPCSYRN
jgi:hypothetical protein